MDNAGYLIDGTWYPRVTKIVSIKSKPALYRFYSTVGYNRAREISSKSAEEGTIVHESVEKLLKGEKVGDVPYSVAASIFAFIDFYRKNEIKFHNEHIERRIFCKENRYAGTIDAVATIGGKTGILDIKTSESIYRDYNIQTAAYLHALKKEIPELETRWILRIDQNQKCDVCGAYRRTKGGREKIKKNGSPLCVSYNHQWAEPKGVVQLKEIEDDYQEDMEGFLGAKKLWEWENRDWLRKAGY